jgi:hypothetical protein
MSSAPSPSGIIPPAALDARRAQWPADWPAAANGADYGEAGPDDITTPMTAIARGSSSHQSQAVPARREPDGMAAARSRPEQSPGLRPADDHAGPAVPPARPGTGGEPGKRRMRGPFEPANDLAAQADESLAGPRYRGRLPSAPSVPPVRLGSSKPMSQAARASIWSPSAAKMDQVKDLHLTAEAIGEDALDKNSKLVSEHQRKLIREYFDDPVASTDGE